MTVWQKNSEQRFGETKRTGEKLRERTQKNREKERTITFQKTVKLWVDWRIVRRYAQRTGTNSPSEGQRTNRQSAKHTRTNSPSEGQRTDKLLERRSNWWTNVISLFLLDCAFFRLFRLFSANILFFVLLDSGAEGNDIQDNLIGLLRLGSSSEENNV